MSYASMRNLALACSALLPCVAPLQARAQGGVPVTPSAGPAQAAANGEPVTAAPPPAATAGSTISEVIVTAEKRSGNLQRTPIAVTALSGSALAKQQVHNLEQIETLVPSLKIGQSGGYAQFDIRGIGASDFIPGAENEVALNLNEVYVSRPIAQLTGLYDLSSIEVLRGPQGTLFGRNATAGAIDVTTARPTNTWSGYANVSLGNDDTRIVEAAIGGPIIEDKLLVRLAGIYNYNSGYGKNLVTGTGIDDKNAYGLRATFVAKLTPELSDTLIGEYYKENDHNGGLHYFGSSQSAGGPGAFPAPPLFQQLGGYAPSNIVNIASPLDSDFALQTTAITNIAEYRHGPFSVRSITGYRQQRSFVDSALDGGSVLNGFFISEEPAVQFSEELQGHYDTQRLHVTTGLYYFKESDAGYPSIAAITNLAIDPAFGIPYTPPTQFLNAAILSGKIHTDAEAAFAQGTYQVIDKLSLTAGIRYSIENKRLARLDGFDPFTPYTSYDNYPLNLSDREEKTFYSLTPKFGANYQLTPRTLLYFSYSKGYKSGGFDISAAGPAFQPEKVTDYEGGVKTTFLDGRVRTNIAAFYYDYTNLQVEQVIGVQEVTTNAASATIYGVEPEITFIPIHNLTVDASVSYLYARYGDYTGVDAVLPLLNAINFSGKALANAPDWRTHLDATYTFDLPVGSADLRGEVDYTTKFYFDPDNLSVAEQNAYVTTNGFFTYRPNQTWQFTLYGRNLTDKITKTSARVNSELFGSPVVGGVTPPRTFGAEISYKF